MIAAIVISNVTHRPIRTLLSILLIGISVTLILCLVGVSRGMTQDSSNRARAVGADIMVKGPGTDLMSFSGNNMPEKLAVKLRAFPHVEMTTGVTNTPGESPFDGIAGVDPVEFDKMSGGFVFDSGHMFSQPGDVIIDTYYALQTHRRVGDTIKLKNHDWRVSGIFEAGKLSHVIVSRQALQDLISDTGKVGVIYVKVDDPANIDLVIKELKDSEDLGGYKVYRIADLSTLMNPNNIGFLRVFIRVVIGIAVIIGFAVTSLSMYMAILQRTREIGILKSLGGSRGFIMSLILAESVILALGGTVAGIVLSFGTRWLLHVFVPASMPQAIVPDWWPYAALVALGGSLLGALYPGYMAVKQDPIEALAYE